MIYDNSHIYIYTDWWFGTCFMTFHSVGNVIIPTDELIFFREIETTNQYTYIYIYTSWQIYPIIQLQLGENGKNQDTADTASFRSVALCQAAGICDDLEVHALLHHSHMARTATETACLLPRLFGKEIVFELSKVSWFDII